MKKPKKAKVKTKEDMQQICRERNYHNLDDGLFSVEQDYFEIKAKCVCKDCFATVYLEGKWL